MDKHELSQALKNLALEMGRTPTRAEFERNTPGGKYALQREFGTYTILLKAAGFDSYNERRSPKKIDNSIFIKNIESHLDAYQPKPYEPPGPYPTAAIISDIHFPFSCDRVLNAFYEYVETEKPEWVICNGDLFDMYSHSKYARFHNVFTPREEEALARKKAEEFWAKLVSISPDSKFVLMLGNHDLRPMKRVLETYPEAEDWINEKLKTLFTFPSVKTFFDPREELYLDDRTIVFHGYRGKLGDHRDYTLYNCINGHTHVGGVVWRQLRSELIYEANSGVAGDPQAKGLTYTNQKVTHWTPGFLGINRRGPQFIPS